jgi:hypothetical protein
VVRGAGGGAEGLDLLEDPVREGLGVQEGLRLLVQVALVGRPAALGHEQELVGVPVDGGDLDLGRQVVAGVLLFVHVERRHLRVAQVARQVRVEHAPCDRLLVASAGEDELALLALHDRRTGVLAHRQHAAGGDVGVLQEVEGDEAVVVAGLRVVEDVAQLLEVAGAQQVGDVAHRLAGDAGERGRLDPQEPALGRVEGRDALGGHEAEGGLVVTEGQHLGELEVRHGTDGIAGGLG